MPAATRSRGAADGRGEAGFTLLSVLLVTAVVSASALAAALLVRAGAADRRVEVEAIRARALAQGGLARVVAALEDGDPLGERLLTGGGPLEWRLGPDALTLALAREAGRIDLNRGRGDLVAAAMPGTALDPDTARRLLERLARLRRSGEDLERVAALFDPADRFGPARARLAEMFTVATAAEGFDLSAAPPRTIRALQEIASTDRGLGGEVADAGAVADLGRRLGPLGAHRRPLYRVTVRSGPGTALDALAAKNASTGRITTFGGGEPDLRASASGEEARIGR